MIIPHAGRTFEAYGADAPFFEAVQDARIKDVYQDSYAEALLKWEIACEITEVLDGIIPKPEYDGVVCEDFEAELAEELPPSFLQEYLQDEESLRLWQISENARVNQWIHDRIDQGSVFPSHEEIKIVRQDFRSRHAQTEAMK